MCFVPTLVGLSSIVRMRVPVYGPIFYTLVIFFDHQSHGSFCSSLKAWGLIQRSSETCKLSISHCKVCKPPSAPLQPCLLCIIPAPTPLKGWLLLYSPVGLTPAWEKDDCIITHLPFVSLFWH